MDDKYMLQFDGKKANTTSLKDGKIIAVYKNKSGDILIVVNQPGQPEHKVAYTKEGWKIIKWLYKQH